MLPDASSTPTLRADAVRNRARILATARALFAASNGPVSMAEVARRSDVGMATLYRHFPTRRHLLETLYAGEVDSICTDAKNSGAATPGDCFERWIERFGEFLNTKHDIAVELLEITDDENPIFDGSRARVLASGRPLLRAAQRSAEIRDDLSLEQVLDLVIAVGRIHGGDAYLAPIRRAALDGIRTTRAA